MEWTTLEKLLRNRFDLDRTLALTIMEVKQGFDSQGSYYQVAVLMFKTYNQEKLERKVFKLRY